MRARRSTVYRATALASVLAVALAGCGGSGSSGEKLPKLSALSALGKGEGQLNLIAWAGYLQPQWVKPFEQQTGCMIHATYPNTSDEFVTLMNNGGGGQWDMASSSGDADDASIMARPPHPHPAVPRAYP